MSPPDSWWVSGGVDPCGLSMCSRAVCAWSSPPCTVRFTIDEIAGARGGLIAVLPARAKRAESMVVVAAAVLALGLLASALGAASGVFAQASDAEHVALCVAAASVSRARHASRGSGGRRRAREDTRGSHCMRLVVSRCACVKCICHRHSARDLSLDLPHVVGKMVGEGGVTSTADELTDGRVGRWERIIKEGHHKRLVLGGASRPGDVGLRHHH